MKHAAILIVAVALAGIRISGHTSDIFKTTAHLFDAALLGAWLATRKLPPMQSMAEWREVTDFGRFCGLVGWTLAIVELACFVVMKLSELVGQ